MQAKIIELPDLHEAQQHVRDTARRYNVACCGRRWGKDVLLRTIILEEFCKGHKVGALLPTDNDAEKFFEYVCDPLSELIARRVCQRNRALKRLRMGDGEFSVYTAVAADRVRGSRYHLFVVNEGGVVAQIVPLVRVWQEVIRPTLIDFRGSFWAAGTPKGLNGFYDLWKKGQDGDQDWMSWQYSSFDNPTISREEVQALIEKEALSQKAIDQEIYARFVEDAGDVFAGLDRVCVLQPIAPQRGARIVAGIDFGGLRDYTAISIMDCTDETVRETKIEYWRDPSTKNNVERALMILQQNHVIEAYIEQNSIGKPHLDWMQDMGTRRGLYTLLTPFHVSVDSKDEMVRAFSYAMEQGALLLQNDQYAAGELAAYRVSRTDTGKRRYSAPAGMHDDTVVARLLAYRCASRYVQVARSSVNLYYHLPLNRYREGDAIVVLPRYI